MTKSVVVTGTTPTSQKGPEKPQNVKVVAVVAASIPPISSTTLCDTIDTKVRATPYISSFTPHAIDSTTFTDLNVLNDIDVIMLTRPNLRRWFTHVRSFSHAQRSAWV